MKRREWFTAGMIALASFLLLASAAQAHPDPAEHEQRRAARQILEQLLAEDEYVHHSRNYRGHDSLFIQTRARASDKGGLCRKDSLSIERDPAAPAGREGPGGIRKVESTPWFYVLTDSGKKPLWEVTGEELERRCSKVSTREGDWFEAEGGPEAKAAVVALSALKTELLKALPGRDVWTCLMRRGCPDPRKVADLIEPLDPGTVTGGEAALERCPEDRWCLTVQLQDPFCGAWVTQIMMDRKDNGRFRSARPTWRAGMLECGEREMNDVGGGAFHK